MNFIQTPRLLVQPEKEKGGSHLHRQDSPFCLRDSKLATEANKEMEQQEEEEGGGRMGDTAPDIFHREYSSVH